MTKIKIQNLDIKRDNKILINNFNYDFAQNLVFALVGDNGSGKTTLLKTLAGLLLPSRNHIFIDDRDLVSLPQRERASLISFLLQYSIEQSYSTALNRIAHGLIPHFGFDFFLEPHHLLMIEEIAQRLNIHHLLHRRLAHLSGGEQRLIHLGKCLVNPHHQILLLDEPSVFLDFTQQNRLGEVLQECALKGKLVIFSSHDAGFIERFAHRIIKIEHQQASITTLYKPSSFDFLANKKDKTVFASSSR